jgi:hypothetical protein
MQFDFVGIFMYPILYSGPDNPAHGVLIVWQDQADRRTSGDRVAGLMTSPSWLTRLTSTACSQSSTSNAGSGP